MQNRRFTLLIFLTIFIGFFVSSCKESKPKGDEFAWDPDGKSLAMINVESQELLILEIENDAIKKITPIDSISGDKVKIYSPSWSPDGEFLLYSKASKKTLGIFVYSLSENTIALIDNLPITENEDFKGKAFPSWSPRENQILWVAWNNQGNNRIFSCSPDGSNKRLLANVMGDEVMPTWSPNGEGIAYAIFNREPNENNGLWKIKNDGTNHQQIYKAYRIANFQWSPDITSIAVIHENETTTDLKFGLKIIDLDGNEQQILTWEKLEIIKLDWSPDRQKIIYIQEEDDTRNIWVVDLTSQKKVKLTFDNLEDYFGWAGQNQLFYSVKYPAELVKQTKDEKERREFSEAIRGIKKENILMTIVNFKPMKLDKNIYSFTYCRQNNASAYFKLFEPDFLHSIIYFPVIEFSNERKVYLARSKMEHVSSADELYLNQKYDRTLNHLSDYWNIDLKSADFKSGFDVDAIIKEMNADFDSSRYRLLLEGFKDGTLLKTLMTFRKLDQKDKSEWLFEQYKKLTFHTFINKENKQDVLDEVFWSMIGAYGRYNEFDSGIKDLDFILAADTLDSTFITYANFAQAILAFENNQYNLGLEKMKSSINYIPQDLADIDDMEDLLSLYLVNLKTENESLFISIIKQMIQKLSTNENVSKVYEILGDLYVKTGQQDKAFEAYQSAVVLQFDKNEIWNKLLETR